MLSTIGYEGAALEGLISTLTGARVDIVVDIRERAQSRRKGFSKGALTAALHAAGIDYAHRRELGDPKEGRIAARLGDWTKFRRIFARVLNTTDAQRAIDELVELAGKRRVCLLCYERDVRTCHRKIISEILERRLGKRTRHLGVSPLERQAA